MNEYTKEPGVPLRDGSGGGVGGNRGRGVRDGNCRAPLSKLIIAGNKVVFKETVKTIASYERIGQLCRRGNIYGEIIIYFTDGTNTGDTGMAYINEYVAREGSEDIEK